MFWEVGESDSGALGQRSGREVGQRESGQCDYSSASGSAGGLGNMVSCSVGFCNSGAVGSGQ
jgi:hypothetical protein